MVYFIKRVKPDIVYIDYLSLLKPENERVPKHEQLGEITRLAKKAAVQLNIPIVLLAQLNKDEQVKYSGAINENSGLTIQWTYRRDKAESDDNRDLRAETLEMSITKARNQRRFNFNVNAEFQFMRFGGVDESDDNDSRIKRKGVNELSPEADL